MLKKTPILILIFLAAFNVVVFAAESVSDSIETLTQKDGFKIWNGKVFVNSANGKIEVVAPEFFDEFYNPPSIPDPAIVEQEILADEAVKDISPVSQ